MKETLPLFGVLLLLGAGWGITMPLTKVTVGAGYQHFGLIFWQFAIGAALMGSALLARRKLSLPTLSQWRFAAMIALIGTLLPNSASYQAAVYLPSGVISILLSLIPMIAFPIALALGNDRFSNRKLIGLTLGFAAVVLIALNSGSFGGTVSLWWVAVALIAPSFYALEGNVVAKWGTYGFDAMQTLFWASVIGLLPALFLALGSGQFIAVPRVWGTPEYAFLLASIAHALVYAGYVWLVGRAGAVFTAQVSYLVTIFGVFWAVMLLGELYASGIWAALGLMLCGLFLVQPRGKQPSVEVMP
ncbi:DMT family transporter [Planktotalea arctica]|uniref:DMT family transporter n=1 Tax=Planktotalea arctica TaxID=1481893 RepID=UPI00321A5587